MEVTFMKPVGLISTGVLLLFLGTVAPTYAHQEQQEQEAKPEKQQQGKDKQGQAKNKQQQQRAQQLPVTSLKGLN
jgi:sortase (surface protein transpeptidase)